MIIVYNTVLLQEIIIHNRFTGTGVEADMAELEIDKEDVHDKSKWRRRM